MCRRKQCVAFSHLVARTHTHSSTELSCGTERGARVTAQWAVHRLGSTHVLTFTGARRRSEFTFICKLFRSILHILRAYCVHPMCLCVCEWWHVTHLRVVTLLLFVSSNTPPVSTAMSDWMNPSFTTLLSSSKILWSIWKRWQRRKRCRFNNNDNNNRPKHFLLFLIA